MLSKRDIINSAMFISCSIKAYKSDGTCVQGDGNVAGLRDSFRIGGSDGRVSDLRQDDTKELLGSTDNFCVGFYSEPNEPVEQDIFLCAQHRCSFNEGDNDGDAAVFCAYEK